MGEDRAVCLRCPDAHFPRTPWLVPTWGAPRHGWSRQAPEAAEGGGFPGCQGRGVGVGSVYSRGGSLGVGSPSSQHPEVGGALRLSGLLDWRLVLWVPRSAMGGRRLPALRYQSVGGNPGAALGRWTAGAERFPRSPLAPQELRLSGGGWGPAARTTQRRGRGRRGTDKGMLRDPPGPVRPRARVRDPAPARKGGASGGTHCACAEGRGEREPAPAAPAQRSGESAGRRPRPLRLRRPRRGVCVVCARSRRWAASSAAAAAAPGSAHAPPAPARGLGPLPLLRAPAPRAPARPRSMQQQHPRRRRRRRL